MAYQMQCDFLNIFEEKFKTLPWRHKRRLENLETHVLFVS